jgi:predicted murein hydrolase (TIGR00659 family)
VQSGIDSRCHRHIFLLATKTDYQTYFAGAQFVQFLLGLATVALAVPLYRQLNILKKSFLIIIFSIGIGAVISAVSAFCLARWLGASQNTLLSILAKSVTAPISMGITEQIGGTPSLTAVFTLLTGVTGAMIAPYILNFLKIDNMAIRGVAIGTSSHGIGTARALQINETAGAFSGLAIVITGLISALLLPLIIKILL